MQMSKEKLDLINKNKNNCDFMALLTLFMIIAFSAWHLIAFIT